MKSLDYYRELEAALRSDADMLRAHYGSTARLQSDEAADAIRDLLRAATKNTARRNLA